MTDRSLRFESVAWDDPRALRLRALMDKEMNGRYMAPGATTLADSILKALAVDPKDLAATVLVTDADGSILGHAALRMLRGEWEVKRVIVIGDQRGRGVGRALMGELERIASAGGASRLILQTGDRQPEAVSLYERLDYTRIPIYEPYVESLPFSICFEKRLG